MIDIIFKNKIFIFLTWLIISISVSSISFLVLNYHFYYKGVELQKNRDSENIFNNIKNTATTKIDDDIVKNVAESLIMNSQANINLTKSSNGKIEWEVSYNFNNDDSRKVVKYDDEFTINSSKYVYKYTYFNRPLWYKHLFRAMTFSIFEDEDGKRGNYLYRSYPFYSGLFIYSILIATILYLFFINRQSYLKLIKEKNITIERNREDLNQREELIEKKNKHIKDLEFLKNKAEMDSDIYIAYSKEIELDQEILKEEIKNLYEYKIIADMLQNDKSTWENLKNAENMLVDELRDENIKLKTILSEKDSKIMNLLSVVEESNIALKRILTDKKNVDYSLNAKNNDENVVFVKNVQDAVELAEKTFTDGLIFIKNAKKSAEQCQYRFPDKVYLLLQTTHNVCKQWKSSLDNKTSINLYNIFKQHGYEFTACISSTAKTMFGDKYTFEYNNKKIIFENHITVGGIFDQKNCFSVHMYFDKENRKIVIGHIGKHLPNDTSRNT